MLMLNTGNSSAKRRKEWMNKYPDSSPNSLRIIDPWDPSTNHELEAAANALLSADTVDGPAILTVDKLRARREREVYSPEDRIETNSGLYIRSNDARDMSREVEDAVQANNGKARNE